MGGRVMGQDGIEWYLGRSDGGTDGRWVGGWVVNGLPDD